MQQNDESIKRSVREFYEAHGAEFSATRRGAWDVMRLIQEVVQPGMTLVDVGAGNARLAREIPDDVRYIAIEPSSSMRQEAERFLVSRSVSNVRMGGFPRLPAEEGEADVVACLAVLHHLTLDARKAAVDELHRILKPGGTLVLTVWNLRSRRFFKPRVWLASWLRIGTVKEGGSGDVWISWQADDASVLRYVHCFTLKELRALFDETRWSIERCEPWGGGDRASILEGRNLVVVARKR